MRRVALVVALVLLVVGPAAASAAHSSAGSVGPSTTSGLAIPTRTDVPPPGYVLSARAATAIAAQVAKVRSAVRSHVGAYPVAYEDGPGTWQVSWFDRKGAEIALVVLDDRNGRVTQAWTGFQVAWTMARGYPGAFGRKANALYVWIPLSLLFLAPFWDLRRPLRMLHLDLLMLLSFSISLAFFNHAAIYQSVPLCYAPLVYLLARMLWIGLGRGADPRRLRLTVPTGWLAIAVVFLVGFRVGLNVTDSNVIDVGYAGVIGAQHIVRGQPLYGHFPSDNANGDTYGPMVYEAYVPFEQLFGFSGRWDDLPAAHGAAVAFDLICVLLLFLLGRRVRGPTLGLALAYAWVAYPFTLFTADSNSNDALVAALIIAALLLVSSAPARGAASALAGLTKFAPLALAPLLAVHGLGDERLRHRRALLVVLFALAFAAAAALSLAPVFAHGSLATMYDRTISYQANRGSPFSIWGLYGGLGSVQTAVQVGAVVLAIALAVLPHRGDLIGLAALCAAIVIAVQLGVTHWFYLYIVWFLPLVLIALFGRHEQLFDRLGAQLS
jgi:hypothetical protein